MAGGPRSEPRFIALAPGSIWGTKRWPYYAELAAGLERACVVVGGADDRPLGRGHRGGGTDEP